MSEATAAPRRWFDQANVEPAVFELRPDYRALLVLGEVLSDALRATSPGVRLSIRILGR